MHVIVRTAMDDNANTILCEEREVPKFLLLFPKQSFALERRIAPCVSQDQTYLGVDLQPVNHNHHHHQEWRQQQNYQQQRE